LLQKELRQQAGLRLFPRRLNYQTFYHLLV